MLENQSDSIYSNSMGVYIIEKNYNPDDNMPILDTGTDNVIYYKCDLYQKLLTT